MQKFSHSLLITLVLSSVSMGVQAKDITVMISGGFKAALEKLAPQFEAKSGDNLILISGPSMGKTPQAIPARLARGEKADVVIMVGDALTHLQNDNWIQPGSRVELADSPIGMVVKRGAPIPKIEKTADLRNTLLHVKSIAYSDSASGRYISGQLFKKMGLEAELQEKAYKVERIPVAAEVAKGKYELGFQQVSELLPVSGVTFIGELPEDVQYITRFAGAITATAEHRQQGKALLDFLSSAQVQKTIRATGMRSVKAEQPAKESDTAQ
ncbi:substrate-binding domain-containing protein [Serratia sp. NPDC078593]|uniref:substrate-binding domain-containing protein n=1 Tax=unclassified Serratia (in: enterobacteria) TaxID=2647522 RepID=UPI0037D44C10